MRDAAIDRPRSACTGAAVRGGLRALALIDTPEFYGTLATSLQGEVALMWRGFEIDLGARVIDWRFAQNAVVTASEFSVGPVQVGVARTLRASPQLVWAPFVRVDLPGTDTGFSEVTGAIAAGVVATMSLRPGLIGHGRIAALGWSATPVDDPTWRAAGLVSADVGWSARPWLAVLAGVELQAGWYRSGIDHTLARIGVRFRKCLGTVDVAAALPLLGAERADAVLYVGLGRQL